MSNPDPPATAPLPLLGRRLREGDPDALAALFEREASTVYHLALGYLRSEAGAEDVVQGVFTRAWERHAELREPDRVRGWLFSIARNLIRDQLRTPPTESVDDHYALPAPGPAPEQEAAASEERDLVWTAAQSLEPRQALILDMAVRQQLTSSEIGEALGYRSGHAAVLLNRAKEALGRAVTALLVARRVDLCERLAALVPQGVRTLSPSERRTVDHHMRRCEICQQSARLLTSRAELFSLVPVAPFAGEAMQRIWSTLSGSLGDPRLTAAHIGVRGLQAPASGAARGPTLRTPAASSQPRRLGLHLTHGLRSPVGFAALAAAVAVAVAVPLLVLPRFAATTALGSSAPTPRTSSPGTPTTTLTPPSTPLLASNWSAPSVIASTYLSAVSCPSMTFCVAAESVSGGVLTFDGSSWSSASILYPNDAFTSVSCPSSSFCVAVDGDGGLVTYDGIAWSPRSTEGYVNDSFSSVSCTSSSFCVAVGDSLAMTYDGNSWSMPTPIEPVSPGSLGAPGEDLSAVSCASSSFCVAVDDGGHALTYNGTSWSTPDLIDPGGFLSAVSCPTSSFCVAVDGNGNALVYKGGSWDVPIAIDPGLSPSVYCAGGVFCLASVSCSSSDFCVAAYGNGNVVTYDGSSWSRPTSLNILDLKSVSCASSSFCMAIGYDGAASAFRGSS